MFVSVQQICELSMISYEKFEFIYSDSLSKLVSTNTKGWDIAFPWSLIWGNQFRSVLSVHLICFFFQFHISNVTFGDSSW